MTLQVFISYKSEYRNFARTVKGQLNQWGYDTWLDVDNIQPGDYFRHKIQEGLDSSDVLLMVLTEEAQLSREVMAEVDYFLDVAKKPVVPLRHQDCKPLYIFVSIQYIDFVSDETNGFVKLESRLHELAQMAVISDNAIVTKPEPEQEEAPKPITPVPNDWLAQDHEKRRKEASPEGSVGAPAQPSAPPPPLQPMAPQAHREQTPAASGGTQLPQIEYQPTRQADYLSQPAPKLRRSPILWPMAGAAALIVVVGVVVLLLNTNASITHTAQPSSQPNPLIWVGLVAVLGVVSYVGWRRFGSNAREGLSPSPTQEAENRNVMLQKVEDYWLKGVLDPALEAGTLDIGLSSAPGAVLRHKDYGDYELPANANILDVFNDLNRELLILGAPGGGKTVLLLELAKQLVNQARQVTTKPIPLVVNLSSWAADRKSLANWLVDELRHKYQVPKKIATSWIEDQELLLLLDGLDEVAQQYRDACVDAINHFRQQYRKIDLAVCSRIADYDALTNKLDLHGAVVLEPLSQPTIDAYLDRPELANLQQIMRTDKELQDMSHVPFLLNAMVYAYAGASEASLEIPNHLTASSINEEGMQAKSRRTHLFDRWVEKRLNGRPNTEYTTKVKRWLRWLAGKMIIFEKIIFYIEELQPVWLSERSYLLYRLGDEIIFVLNHVVLIGLFFGIVGILFTIVTNGIYLRDIFAGFANGVVVGVIVGLALRIHDWLPNRHQFKLADAGSDVDGITARGGIDGKIPGSNTFQLPRKDIFIPVIDLEVSNNTDIPQKPNELIFKITYTAVLIGLISALAFGIIFGLTYGWISGLIGAIIFGGFVLVELNTGKIVLKHFILRLIIWRHGDAPWNYARFLDYCVSAGLMRKVGGGYIFAHRYLMEYFAETSQ